MDHFIFRLREAVEASIEHALSKQEGPAKREAAVADEAWEALRTVAVNEIVWTL